MMATPPRLDRRLIVNGDDFGLSPQVNAGILHAHTQGILTSTSLIVTGAAWQEAVALAKDTPSLSVGLHVTLVQGRAVLPPHLLTSVTEWNGAFSDNPTTAGLRYFFSPQARVQIRDECRAQIERFLKTGLPLAHLDGHVNIHMHPVVLDTLLDLASEYDVNAMRLTREDVRTSLACDPRHSLRKRWESFIFTRLSRVAERKLRGQGIAFPDALFGLHQSGDISERYLLRLLPRLRGGVTELYCHPAFLPCKEAQYWTPTYRREVELAALTSPAVRAALADQGITLISYRDL
ncbi:MAG TPA: hopanoid biosynthesis-associated protein HpnK [Methylomirabilota bacterium]|jgi:hopanoid biosynthesis associated protein HpnK|nr:hopanoid biosynthesis-associated protein HpnK [Methylomirabilota bacterium]